MKGHLRKVYLLSQVGWWIDNWDTGFHELETPSGQIRNARHVGEVPHITIEPTLESLNLYSLLDAIDFELNWCDVITLTSKNVTVRKVEAVHSSFPQTSQWTALGRLPLLLAILLTFISHFYNARVFLHRDWIRRPPIRKSLPTMQRTTSNPIGLTKR